MIANAMEQNSLWMVLDHSLREVSDRYGGMELSPRAVTLSTDACAVSTVFTGKHSSVLTLCADWAVFNRLAQRVMGRAEVTPEDVADVATEYLNIICGKVVAGLYEQTRTALRFQIPRFTSEVKQILQERDGWQHVLDYQHGEHGSIRLIYAEAAASQS